MSCGLNHWQSLCRLATALRNTARAATMLLRTRCCGPEESSFPCKVIRAGGHPPLGGLCFLLNSFPSFADMALGGIRLANAESERELVVQARVG